MARFLTLWTATLGLVMLYAQTPMTPPAFDAASIKPSAPDRSGAPPYRLGRGLFSMQGCLDHLKLHRETRPMPGYLLVVDKNGPRLPPPRTDVPAESDGVIQIGDGIWARGVPMSHLAYGLTLSIGQPVVNATKIEGHYDLKLQFDDGDDAGAIGSIFPALHEIGLKLERRKVPVEVLVIDSAERPSAN
jgi:Protein of unknown function (DUF3738)